MKPKALIFDVFGSVVDWRTGVAQYCKPIFKAKNIAHDPYEFADKWRAQYQPTMQKIRSGNRGYVALDILHRENLELVLAERKLDHQFNENELDQLNLAWEHLPPWTDSVAGLTKLRTQFTIAPCSNGSISLMTNLAKFGGLPWDDYVGAEIAQNYKPEPIVYIKSVEKLGLKPSDVMMVAAHNSDLQAASEAGLQTAFFARPTEHGPDQAADLMPTSNWDYLAQNIEDLSRQLCD